MLAGCYITAISISQPQVAYFCGIVVIVFSIPAKFDNFVLMMHRVDRKNVQLRSMEEDLTWCFQNPPEERTHDSVSSRNSLIPVELAKIKLEECTASTTKEQLLYRQDQSLNFSKQVTPNSQIRYRSERAAAVFRQKNVEPSLEAVTTGYPHGYTCHSVRASPGEYPFDSLPPAREAHMQETIISLESDNEAFAMNRMDRRETNVPPESTKKSPSIAFVQTFKKGKQDSDSYYHRDRFLPEHLPMTTLEKCPTLTEMELVGRLQAFRKNNQA